MSRLLKPVIVPALLMSFVVAAAPTAEAQKKAAATRSAVIRDEDLPYPPTLPEGQTLVTDASPKFLVRPDSLREDVTVAKTAPTIEFLFYPEQNYPG